jgi:hypothetical protein
MQYLQDTLSHVPQMKWQQVPAKEDPDVKPVNVTATLSDVSTDAASCTVSLKAERNFPNEHYRAVLTWKVPVQEIGKVTVETLEDNVSRFRASHGGGRWDTKTVPAVYVLTIAALADHKLECHRWSLNADNEVIEKEQPEPEAVIPISGEEAARNIASALEKAKSLCGR